MNDQTIRLLSARPQLRASVTAISATARQASDAHQLLQTSDAVMSQATAAAVLLASTLKGTQRLNLQLECDGPLRGALIDAGADGTFRGYVKNTNLAQGHFNWRAALGNAGFLSVLRPQPNGEFYRSAVELTAFDLEADLQHFLTQSEQVASAVALVPSADFKSVTGVLIQTLPGGDESALAKLRTNLHQRVRDAVNSNLGIEDIAKAALHGFDADIVDRVPVTWRCTCSRERVLDMLRSLGRDELKAIAEEQGEAVVTCEFCSTKHRASADELRAMIHAAVN
jgi:molecular chaperone Hsp33